MDLIIEQQCEVEVGKVHKLDQIISYNFFKLLLSNIKEVKSNSKMTGVKPKNFSSEH